MHEAIVTWYRHNSRDLPWRASDRTPWGVLVSEVMLQQTPVSRVEPVWREWMTRWPRPADLAAVSPADAIRAWGKLGYPRRATRLHKTAQVIESDHRGMVPDRYVDLLTLPGVGEYTAAAVATFAFGRRHPALDTNVRRVLARAVSGRAQPGPSASAAEHRLAKSLLPEDDALAAEWSVAVMELGALVCTSRAPDCRNCPIRRSCAWRSAGSPAYDGPVRPTQAWHGTDRQVRGRLMAVLRESASPVAKQALDAVWPEHEQRERALVSLITDELVAITTDGEYCLPDGKS